MVSPPCTEDDRANPAGSADGQLQAVLGLFSAIALVVGGVIGHVFL